MQRPPVVAGAILTGGASRRMGATKALIEIDGAAMASRVADALNAAGNHAVVLVGGDPAELAPLAMPVIEDRYPGEGPIGGVITALGHHADEATHVVVSACDLPAIDAATINALTARIGTSDVVVAETDRIEPVLAVWSVASLTEIERHFSAGVRAMHELLGHLDVTTVAVDPAALRNVNRPGDLHRGIPGGLPDDDEIGQ